MQDDGLPSVLVVAPSWIGDMVMAQPMIALMHRQGPVNIDVLALPWIRALLTRMPGIRHVVDMPIGHGRLAIKERYRTGRALRGRYEQAIVLPNTLKSALIPWFAGIQKRTGYTGEARYGLLNDRRELDRENMPGLVQRYAALAVHKAELPEVRYPVLQVTTDQQQQTCEKLGIATGESKIIGLCPGAEYGEAKRWPVGHYAHVASRLIEAGDEVWLFGSEKDAAVTRAINQQTGDRCRDMAGKTTLDQAIDLMSLTQTIVTNDSGLMHVASALGVNVIAVFGSTSYRYTPPLSDKAVVLSLDLECSPCFERECPLGHMNCLTQLSPERVLQEIS